MSKYRDHWNRRIRDGADPSKFNQDTMERMSRESGPFWVYQQSPHNTDAYKEGWERTFGSKPEHITKEVGA